MIRTQLWAALRMAATGIALLAAVTLSAGSAPAGMWEPVAAFDVNERDGGGASPTQAGFAALDDGGSGTWRPPFSTTQSGVTLTVTRAEDDRDRGADGNLSGHPQAAVLRDNVFSHYTGNTPSDALQLDLAGLKPKTGYVVRVFSYDPDYNDRNTSVWLDDSATTTATGDPAYLTLHQNLQAEPQAGFFDVLLTSSATGTLGLLSRATSYSSTGVTTYANGVEVFERSRGEAAAMFDINNGASPTAPGYTPVAMSGATGTASAGGIGITVTSDRSDGSRDRGVAASPLLRDFALSNDQMTIDLTGLTPGKEYEVTIFGQDLTNSN